MREPVEQGGGHLRVAEHAGPFGERQVRCDQHTRVLVQLAEQVEQQRPSGLAEGQVAQLVQYDQVHAQQAAGNPSGLALCLLLLQRIDQVDRRVEPHALGVPRDTCHANGGPQVRFPGAGPADQNHVVRILGELATGQLMDQLGVHRRAGEVEAREVAVHRELGCMHLVIHRTHATVGALGLQQLLDEPSRVVQIHLGALFGQVAPGTCHAVQTKLLEFHDDVTHGAPPARLRRLSGGRSGPCPHAAAPGSEGPLRPPGASAWHPDVPTR
ncbi:Uncharacterised protein [Xylophilus ampelinus]|nr:Uncharacterised protein [Xylophilus ampelinus]